MMAINVLKLLEGEEDLDNIELIGEGAFTSVYKVVQEVSNYKREQVVRVLTDISNIHAIRREKKLLNYLNKNERFIHFNELRKVGSTYLQFFDFMGEYNLRQFIANNGTLTEIAVRNLLKDLLEILNYVHSTGFVHGDIKPSNIVLGSQRSYLIDWSNSIPEVSSFESEIMTGDKRYCPPERLNGRLDHCSDIYSLGCTLFFAFTGKHIYKLDKVSNEWKQLWASVNHFPFESRNIPILWKNLISWMVQKKPENRPSLAQIESWLIQPEVPDWVLNQTCDDDYSYPTEPMVSLSEQGHLYALFKLALESEDGGEIETAIELYEDCSNRGYSRASSNLGLLYESDVYQTSSYELAASYYTKAYDKGNSFAAYNLAKLYRTGNGVALNLDSSFKLCKFAALRGNLKAQNMLGMMFFEGIGTSKDFFQAKSWLVLAANAGSKEAQKNLSLLA